jgi:hypothetical protein
MSVSPFVSPGTRRPKLRNTTAVPSRATTAESELPLAWEPSLVRLTRVVVEVWRSKTKMSYLLFVSPATRLVAALR